MKSKAPRKKLLSDYSSQDETAMRRSLKADMPMKRNKKPSIYDEMDDDFMDEYDDDLDGYDEEEDDLEEDED